MFQTFEATTQPSTSGPRLQAVRKKMQRLRLDALLVPRTDEHQGEYVTPRSERLKWLTGFTGSAGLCVVTQTHAHLLVDGRYREQAQTQIDPHVMDVTVISGTFDVAMLQCLSSKLHSDQIVGFDPWLHTIDQIEALRSGLEPHQVAVRATSANLIDHAWTQDRPAARATDIALHGIEFTGQTALEKIAVLKTELRRAGDSALIVTLPDNIAWLFNIRGTDIPHTPVALAFAIIHTEAKPELFFSHATPTGNARRELTSIADIYQPSELSTRLQLVSASDARIRIDPRSAAYWFLQKIGPKRKNIHRAPDPITASKARKNTVELAGARRAHVRDGAALCEFLHWFDTAAAAGELDEIGAARKLEEFRQNTGVLQDISFDTIAGSGPNGAIVHYRVTEGSNRRIGSGDLFLLDSGGQYPDGTTDVTRTVAVGPVSAPTRTHFTLVLKGHIAIATARFPVGTRGIDIDGFARAALWSHGLDYDHGTGHGVGSFLSVHEGPQSISRRGMAVLEPGMICSNEPGYYKSAAYGIRLENLCIVTPPTAIEGGDRDMLGFETLTLAPFDRKLIERALLTPNECQWLNSYHRRVLGEIGPKLDAEARHWLNDATAPI